MCSSRGTPTGAKPPRTAPAASSRAHPGQPLGPEQSHRLRREEQRQCPRRLQDLVPGRRVSVATGEYLEQLPAQRLNPVPTAMPAPSARRGMGRGSHCPHTRSVAMKGGPAGREKRPRAAGIVGMRAPTPIPAGTWGRVGRARRRRPGRSQWVQGSPEGCQRASCCPGRHKMFRMDRQGKKKQSRQRDRQKGRLKMTILDLQSTDKEIEEAVRFLNADDRPRSVSEKH
jgi:hypothetical protein